MILLCIMDGFGLREATPDNAIAAATKPNYDWLTANCPHTAIDGSGLAAGLPEGQMGNSEVGHLNLGAGRVVYQEITRIDKSIAEGDFFDNNVLNAGMERVASENRAVHLFGLISDGCVHSSLNHLYALVEMARRNNVHEVYLHAFMDGRDTPPTSGADYMAQVVDKFNEIGLGQVATVGGRYYGMDRDQRWDRNEKAYRAIVHGEGIRATDPVAAIKESYANDVTDEFIMPMVIDLGSPETGRLKQHDLALFFNFRADRVRQLSRMLLGYEIEGVNHPDNPQVELITLTSYDVTMSEAKVAFSPMKLNNILGEVPAREGRKQLRTAETEKYAHVTFFFNGGTEKPFAGEDRDLIPSPKVATYDLQPEMSSVAVTDNAVAKIASGKYDLVVLNYANCDMVGHTGVFDAARAAVEAVDTGLGRLMEAVKDQQGVAIITADHGNAEMMVDPTNGGPFTAHTTNLVPCILYDPSGKVAGGSGKIQLREGGILADIAPTILEIMGLDIPGEMTGRSLIVRG
ncbi:MAG: 2,3-bisphosphoglycerate-independent phosphoglycerate mutase [bacterium]